MTHSITLISGDGIGPEVTAAVLQIIEAAGVAIDWEHHDAGMLAVARHGAPLPQPLIDGLRGEPAAAPNVDERIVDALVRLAHAIELTVTAEGVETLAQAERLTTLGCDSGQGWYLGQPRTADELAEVLAG